MLHALHNQVLCAFNRQLIAGVGFVVGALCSATCSLTPGFWLCQAATYLQHPGICSHASRAGVGFVIWTLCSVACGLAPGFWSFLAARTIMGAGEASIVNLTGPFIDDIAPPQQKTLWFGILFLVSLIQDMLICISLLYTNPQ